MCSSVKKWFSLSKKFEKYYLPEEDEPHRACKNKNYIPMLMFLCVSVRPRFRDEECIFMRQLVDFSRQVVDDEECLAWNLRYNLK